MEGAGQEILTAAENGDSNAHEVVVEWGEPEIFERLSLHSVLTSLHSARAGVLEAVRPQENDPYEFGIRGLERPSTTCFPSSCEGD